MGSGEAKRFRDLYGSASRHGQSFWDEEKDNVGMKLLQGMGWQAGQGLGKDGHGRTDTIKQFKKKDNSGIGSKVGTRDEHFKASQELFNDVLSRLACGGGADASAASNEPALGAAASSVKGVMARRQLARRFVRSQQDDKKGTGVAGIGGMAKGDMNTADAMNEIFGRSGGSSGAKGGDDDDAAANPDRVSLQQTTSNVSVNDYFARRRAELGLAIGGVGVGVGIGSSSGGGSSRGFTLDDQARFAEQQQASAYTGRRGLGAGSMGGGRGDDDDDDQIKPRLVAAAQAARIAPPPATTFAPPPPAAAAVAATPSKKEAKAAAKAERKALRKAERKAQRKAERKAERKAAKQAAAAKEAETAAAAAAMAAAAAAKGTKKVKMEKKEKKRKRDEDE